MKILVLGAGKTGSLVAEVARERGHAVRALTAVDNEKGCALTEEFLADYDVAIDFTTPDAVMHNIAACVKQRTPIVVGTTGWYGEIDQVKKLVDASGTGLVFGSNFSVGVNLFFAIVRTAAAALKNGYSAQVLERHHVHKKDAPSGTALLLRDAMVDAGFGRPIDMSSTRAGSIPGTHVIGFDAVAETVTFTHTVRDRAVFARGALVAAKWLIGKKGWYSLRDLLADSR